MGVLERIESIIKSNLSDLLENTKDPDRTLRQLISDMEAELADARVQIAATIRAGKRLDMLRTESEQSAAKWQQKAVLAVQHGKDNLAREALLRKQSASVLAEDYSRECELHSDVVASLKSALKGLEAKIQEAKREKDELIMRKRQLEVKRLLGRNVIAEKELTMDRMENKIMSFSEEVEAMGESRDDELIARLREEELETELEKLKNKMKSEEP